MTMSRNPKPLITYHGWVIVTPHNSIWRREIFTTKEDAEQFIETFWNDDKEEIAKLRVIRCKATVETEPETT